MSIAWRELRRTPGRFAVATITLSLIAMLLMFLGATVLAALIVRFPKGHENFVRDAAAATAAADRLPSAQAELDALLERWMALESRAQ